MTTDPLDTHTAHGPPSALVLRPMSRDDCRATAALHVQYLGDGLFPRLGPRFVRRWHRTFVDSVDAVGHVAVRPDGEVLGFVAAATDQRAYVTSTLQEARGSLLVRGGLAMAARPRVAAVFLRTRLRSYWARLRRPVRSAPPGPRTAVVHAIVTSPAARGTGVGRMLLAQVQADVRASSTRCIELVSEDGAHGGADFYRRLGWSEGESFLNRDSRTMVRFSRQVRDGR